MLAQGILGLLFAAPLVAMIRQLLRRGISSLGMPTPWDWPAFAAFAFGLVVAWVYLANRVYAGHNTVLTAEGIVQRGFFGARHLPWGQVSRVVPDNRGLILEGPGYKIRVNMTWFRSPAAVVRYVTAQVPRLAERRALDA